MRILWVNSALFVAIMSGFVAGCTSTGQQGANIHPSDYRARHPIIVSGRGAYVPHKCGQWPEDLGAASVSNTLNEQYWNYGCSTQHNLAAMVANPNDLLAQRQGSGSPDATRRAIVLDKYRKAQDPTTNWKSEDKNKVQTK
jgi:type IV pilus biogenesis protein CpaD/CtpE